MRKSTKIDNKKTHNKIIIISIIAIIIFGIIIFLLFPFSFKRYDVDAIESQFLKYYSDKNLRVMDFVDMTALFGTNFDDTSDVIFMGNVTIDQPYTEDTMLVVVINDDNPIYYYDLLQSHIDSYLMYSDDDILNKLYKNAILVKGKKFVYFIVSNDAKVIEKEINSFYN